MTGPHTEQLKLSVEKIDQKILDILLPHHDLTDAELKKVAVLEQARNAAHRLLKAGQEFLT